MEENIQHNMDFYETIIIRTSTISTTTIINYYEQTPPKSSSTKPQLQHKSNDIRQYLVNDIRDDENHVIMILVMIQYLRLSKVIGILIFSYLVVNYI